MKKWYNVLMTFTQKSILTILALVMPTVALAVNAPANVRGIRVTNTNGNITVTWQAVANNVAFYRVYYSHTSILQNQGNYDDFERTRGTEASYTFVKAPLTSGTLFVSVLAVSPDGIESEGFEEEASLDLGSNAVPQTPSVTTTQDTTSATPMTITSVSPVTETGILVTFSEDVKLTSEIASSGYFVVTDTGGALLPVTKVVIEGASVLIHTIKQIPNTTYILRFTSPIPGVKGGVIETSIAPAKFVGFSQAPVVASTPVVSQVASTEAVKPVYVRNPYVAPPTPIVRVPQEKKGLPHSGIPLVGLMGIAGAGAILQTLRRRKLMTA